MVLVSLAAVDDVLQVLPHSLHLAPVEDHAAHGHHGQHDQRGEHAETDPEDHLGPGINILLEIRMKKGVLSRKMLNLAILSSI